VLAAAVEAAATADSELERRVRAALEEWMPAPAGAILFGSFARRDGDARSDIDLLLVRQDDIDEDDAAWAAHRYDIARSIERWTGNNAQIVELSSAELADALARGDDLIASVRRDGRVLVGVGLRPPPAPPSREAAR
jgi:hypothetical protein